MASIGICNDTSEAIELFDPQGLFLKPIARINISVALPQMKTPGKSISNWELMEKLKKMVKPDQFIIVKVAKSTLEFVRFEGEIENKGKIKVLMQRLDSKTIKLSGFPDELKVRAAEAKPVFPTRHDWESYFRDAKNMNEMKPGERPDTLHLKDLPCRWFCSRKDQDKDLKDKPSEFMVRKVFEVFGEVRCIDIPILDPYRKDMACDIGAIQTFSYGQELLFEAFVQYKDYIGFVKAMTALRGMKLMYKSEDGKALAANVKIDFDKTKHLNEKHIRKRRVEREKLMQLEKEREERVMREREEDERKREEERRRKEDEEKERDRKRVEKRRKNQERRLERENKRRRKQMERRAREDERQMQMKIALEERRILIAQRKLETIRLLSELFNRIKVQQQQQEVQRQERELQQERVRQVGMEKQKQVEMERQKLDFEKKKKHRMERQEHELRNKILKNLKAVEERQAEKQRETLRKTLSGKTRLKSYIIMNK